MPTAARPSVRSAANRSLDAAVERLSAEFPQLSHRDVYVHVGRADAAAQKHLPDLSAYSEAIHAQARALIVAAATSP
jgi:hypothetical protein